MRSIFSKDLLAGMLFLGVGTLGLVLGRNLPLSTVSQIGPGYYPLIVSLGIVAVGSVLAVQALVKQSRERARFSGLRGLVLITLAILVFAGLLERAGLILATAAVVLLGSFASPDRRTREILILCAALALFCAAAFVWGLGLPMRVLPW